MDSFLKAMYQKDLEKRAAADLRAFYDQLPMEDLLELAGVSKVAVAGSAAPTVPTGTAAAVAKVTEKAVPKKTGEPEQPVVGQEPQSEKRREQIDQAQLVRSEKTAGVSFPVNEVLTRGKDVLRGAAKGALVGAPVGAAAGMVADLSNHENDGLGAKRGLHHGALLGALAGGIRGGSNPSGLRKLYEKLTRGVSGMPTNNMAVPLTKLNQARFLKTAMRAVEGAPEHIVRAAIKLAATRAQAPVLGLSEKVPFPGQFDEFDAEEKSFARRFAEGEHPLQQTRQPTARPVGTDATVAAKRGGALKPLRSPVGSSISGPLSASQTGMGPGLKSTMMRAGQQLKSGWGDMSKSLSRGTPRFMTRPGMALQSLKSQSVPMAARVGRAARMVLPHAGLVGGGLLAAHALKGNNQQQQVVRG